MFSLRLPNILRSLFLLYGSSFLIENKHFKDSTNLYFVFI